MNTIKSIKEAEALLQAYVPAVKELTGKSVNLERMMPLMAALDNPQEKLRIIHVAGTSGKTSTSYYTAALLGAAGYSVGLTVSPHIDSIAERIQIDGKPISEEKFCRYLQECLERITSLHIQPSYFELLMALAYFVFHKESVDIAVIETGMGGLLDASNVANQSEKICIITDIGFDHMHILGNTIYEIAQQKAGIVHKGNSVYMYRQGHDIMKAIREQTEQTSADLHLVDEVMPDPMSDLPIYQQRNAVLAYEVVKSIVQADGNRLPPLWQTIEDVTVPARMQRTTIADKTVVMDGAHNEQKMQAFVKSYQAMFPDTKATIVIAMKEGKEYTDVVRQLLPIAGCFVCTSFRTSQDLPAGAISPHLLDDYLKILGARSIVVSDPYEAYESALKQDLKTVVITGSFYLLAQLRKKLR